MYKSIFILLTSLICIQPLTARVVEQEPVKDCIRISERLVVEFPSDEAPMWHCMHAEQTQEGNSCEIWQHERIDADERIVLVTTLWGSDERKSIEEIVAELVVPYKALPIGEGMVIEKEINGNEAFVVATIENEFVFCYRVIVTSCGVHIASFTHQSGDTALMDRERAERILREWCYLIC